MRILINLWMSRGIRRNNWKCESEIIERTKKDTILFREKITSELKQLQKEYKKAMRGPKEINKGDGLHYAIDLLYSNVFPSI